MRMATLELVADAIDHVVECESAGFVRHCCVEDDLELQVTELVSQRIHVIARDRVRNLIGFLDRVGGDGRESLFAIPFTTVHRIAEAAHDRDEPLKRHEGPPIGRYGYDLKV